MCYNSQNSSCIKILQKVQTMLIKIKNVLTNIVIHCSLYWLTNSKVAGLQ